MKIVIIGSGNVATVVGKAILKAGHEIVQVVGRNKKNVSVLAEELNCGYASTFESIDRHSDLYIIAIADNALSDIHKELFLDKKLVVHTAGSVSKNVLRKISTNYGVLYPLQSLRKEIKQIPQMPLLVDGNTIENITLIEDFAGTISENVKIASDEERLKLHIAAVITNNFSNHLFALTEDYCKKENVDFKLLLPLLTETVSRLQFSSAKEMQTGPAIRNDETTIQKHLALLDAYPSFKKMYEFLTESIREYY